MSARSELEEFVKRYGGNAGLLDAFEREAREGLYTKGEVARLQEAEVRTVMKGLLRNLTDVRNQRGAAKLSLPSERTVQIRRMGEIEGLNIAITAVRRRIR